MLFTGAAWLTHLTALVCPALPCPACRPPPTPQVAPAKVPEFEEVKVDVEETLGVADGEVRWT